MVLQLSHVGHHSSYELNTRFYYFVGQNMLPKTLIDTSLYFLYIQDYWRDSKSCKNWNQKFIFLHISLYIWKPYFIDIYKCWSSRYYFLRSVATFIQSGANQQKWTTNNLDSTIIFSYRNKSILFFLPNVPFWKASKEFIKQMKWDLVMKCKLTVHQYNKKVNVREKKYQSQKHIRASHNPVQCWYYYTFFL